MRKFLLALFLTSSCVTTSFAQTLTWQQIDEPWGAPVQSLGQMDGIVFAGTDTGPIFSSSDTGSSWRRLPPLSGLRQFASLGSILVARSWSETARSTDSGMTWASSVTRETVGDVRQLLTIGSSFWIVGSLGVFRSTDTGLTWRKVHAHGNACALCAIGSTLVLVDGRDGNLSGRTSRSTDNGNTWIALDTTFSDRGVDLLISTGRALIALTQYSSRGYCFTSFDSAATWIRTDSALPPGTLTAYSNGRVILASTYNGGFYHSSDSGRTWLPTTSGSMSTTFYAFESVGAVLFGAAQAGMFRSLDEGVSWRSADTGITSDASVDLTHDGKTLFASMPTGLFGTTDDGVHWTRAPGELGFECYAVHVRDTVLLATTGVRGVTDVSALYRSHDRGRSWDSLSWIGTGGIETNKSCVFLTGWTGRLYRSTDDGESWTWLDSAAQPGDRLSLLALGDSLALGEKDSSGQRQLVISEDSCSTWRTVTIVDSQMSAACVDGHSMLLGTRSGIYRSRDLGLSWQRVSPDTTVEYFWISGSYIVTASRVGLTLSTDHGTTWSGINDDRFGTYILVVTMGNGEIFTSPQTGGIYHAKLPLLSSVASRIAPVESHPLSISPNPLHAMATLTYWLDRASPSLLTLFDPLGRAVVTPIKSEFDSAGEHTLPLDCRALAPGVYTARLVAGDMVQVAKFVVAR